MANPAALIAAPVKQLLRRLKEFFILSSGATSVNGRPFIVAQHSAIDYAGSVGDGLDSSVLMSPVKWIQRNFPQAFLEVVNVTEAEPEPVLNHELVRLVERPNLEYTSSALWAGTIFSYIVSGDGYWLKVRKSGKVPWYEDVTSEVEHLWYVPHWIIEPKWPASGDVFISHYEYRPGGPKLEVAKENVIHFRNGIDPRNPRHGLSLIASELREIFTDDEAANFVNTLLRNMGVPGIVVSPDGTGATISPEQAEETKALIIAKTTGDRRGEPLVVTMPAKVQEYGFDPEKMDLGTLRDIAEERICSALGIPAAVVGFGTGLQATKVGATMAQMKRMAWEDCLIPMLGNFADQLGMSLLPDFEGAPEKFQARFNHSEVPAMQDNVREKARWVDTGVRGGWLRVDIAQSMMGVQVDDSQAVYLRPATVVAVPAQTAIVPRPAGGAPAKFRRRLKAKASTTESFLALQEPLEADLIPLIAAQFGEDWKALKGEISSHFGKRTKEKDWVEAALAGRHPEWLDLLEQDLIFKGIELGNELLREDLPLGVAFDLVDGRAVKYAGKHAAKAITQISLTTAEDVRRVLEQATESGWSLTRTKSTLSDLFDQFSESRALTIARTETASAMNWGKYETAKETAKRLEMKLERTWLAVNDGRTRPSHSSADGQTIKLDDVYSVGGSSLKFPGDPDAPPEETVMCRCSESFSEPEE